MPQVRLFSWGLLLTVTTLAQAQGADFETRSSYDKVDDATNVIAQSNFVKSAGTLDSLDLEYSFRGQKQTAFVRPKWVLWLYGSSRPSDAKAGVVTKILVDDKGPALQVKMKFVERDSRFGGDRFEADLSEESEQVLLNAKTLEFIPPSGGMSLSSKLTVAQTTKFKEFLKTANATKPAAEVKPGS
jgi:hypothetical protein